MAKRRRGSRTAIHRALPRARHRPFESLVDDAIASIPMPFAAALAEVAIVIADEPTSDQRRLDDGSLDDSLYGIYEGVPRTDAAADWAPTASRIVLFRLPLEADFPEPDVLADEVWVTLVHELAHHLGIDDDRLAELGVD